MGHGYESHLNFRTGDEIITTISMAWNGESRICTKHCSNVSLRQQDIMEVC